MSGKLRNALSHLRPYGEGGLTAQRWFDISAEATAFQRSKGAGLFNFTSQGAGTNNFVLTSNSVDLDQLRAGLALTETFRLVQDATWKWSTSD